MLELLVEGGPRLQASLWGAGLADRLVWYLAPLAIGGEGAPGCWAGPGRPPWPTPAGCAWPRSTASATTCGWWRSPDRPVGRKAPPDPQTEPYGGP